MLLVMKDPWHKSHCAASKPTEPMYCTSQKRPKAQMSISMFLYSQQAVNNALVLLQASYFEYALARIISFHVVYIVNRGHALHPSSAVSRSALAQHTETFY